MSPITEDEWGVGFPGIQKAQSMMTGLFCGTDFKQLGHRCDPQEDEPH